MCVPGRWSRAQPEVVAPGHAAEDDPLVRALLLGLLGLPPPRRLGHVTQSWHRAAGRIVASAHPRQRTAAFWLCPEDGVTLPEMKTRRVVLAVAVALLAGQAAFMAARAAAPPVARLTWFGQSCFLLESAAGTRVVM